MTSDPAQHVQQVLRGYFVSQALYVAARLGIADLLAAAPGRTRSAAELAADTGMHADALYRVLRALASEGIFHELPERRFTLNASAELLRDGVAGTLRPAALLAGETQYKVWALLKDSVRHGSGAGSAFERVFRQPLFEFLAEHPAHYATFNAAMSQRVAAMRAALVETCAVAPGATIVDVGGGLGNVLVALLRRHPGARGILLETPAAVEQARATLATLEPALRTRLELLPGDFLQAVPRGDVLILATVLHMLEDPPARQLLAHCRHALSPGGRLYVAEDILRAPNEPDPAKWQDLNMLMMTGGRERTFEQYASLLREAGFAGVERVGELIVAAAEGGGVTPGGRA